MPTDAHFALAPYRRPDTTQLRDEISGLRSEVRRLETHELHRERRLRRRLIASGAMVGIVFSVPIVVPFLLWMGIGSVLAAFAAAFAMGLAAALPTAIVATAPDAPGERPSLGRSPWL